MISGNGLTVTQANLLYPDKQTAPFNTAQTVLNGGTFVANSAGTISPASIIINYVPSTILILAAITFQSTPSLATTAAFTCRAAQQDLTSINTNSAVATLSLTTNSVTKTGSGNTYLIIASGTPTFSLQSGVMAVSFNGMTNNTGGTLITGASGTCGYITMELCR